MFIVYRIKANGKRGAKSQPIATRAEAEKLVALYSRVNKSHFGFEIVEA